MSVAAVLAALRRAGSRTHKEGFARYGIVAEKAFGVPMNAIQAIAKKVGTDHELAEALWETGWYEARMATAYIADPARLTVAQMNRWCAEFDNWAVCDTLCFALFDRSPHALGRIAAWQRARPEFVRRAAFALLASVAGHRKDLSAEALAACLPFCEAAADDERNFVKKGVSWALRSVGGRDAELHARVVALATDLAGREGAARWIGKDVLRDLQRPLVAKRLAAKAKAAKAKAAKAKAAKANVKAAKAKAKAKAAKAKAAKAKAAKAKAAKRPAAKTANAAKAKAAK